jgi:bacterioferritin (cytochrome b1)
MRFQGSGKMGLDGLGIQALRELIEYADLQQSSVSRSEFEKYVQKTRNYIKSNSDRVVEIV